MWRMVWKGVVVAVVICGGAQPTRAAAVPSHERAMSKREGRPSLNRARAHTAGDSGMMLAFGVGLFGCASVCAVESHREERRKQAREAKPGLEAALPA